MKNQHILFILGSPPRQGLTGPVIIDRHLKRLPDSYKISIAAPEQSFDGIQFPPLWKLIRIPKRRWWWLPYRRGINILQSIRFWYWLKECEKVLSVERPSVILTILHDIYSVFAAYLSIAWDIPLVIIVHDQVEFLSDSKTHDTWFSTNWKFVLNTATKILPVSYELASAYNIEESSKVQNLYPIPEGNRTSFIHWNDQFKSSPVIGYAGNIYSSQIPILEKIASTISKINGRILLIVPNKNPELLVLLRKFSNIDYQEPFPNNIDAINYLANHATCILVAYPLDISKMLWVATSFPSKLVEFSHLGLPILIIAPTTTALGRWSLEHNWSSYLSDVDDSRLLSVLSDMIDKCKWTQMSSQSIAIAQDEFDPANIQSQFESAISVQSTITKLTTSSKDMNIINIKMFIRNNFPYSLIVKKTFDIIFKNVKISLFEFLNLNKVSASKVFKEKALTNEWGGGESLSGHGSDYKSTEALRLFLPRIFADLNIQSLLDAPCGDFYWMNFTDLNIQEYIGVDIVSELTSQNRDKYGANNRQFLTLDITSDDLPKVDLILCRDCLVHLSFKQIREAVKNFKKSGSTYLLTTTYPNLVQVNKNIVTGDWRPVDLQKPPFNFPEPIQLINENCVTDLKEKSLGLWKISDIEI